MFIILWKFRPPPDREAAFEAAYGPAGDWAQLFQRTRGYAGTELWQSRGGQGDYLVSDRWESESDYWRFRQENHAAYTELNTRLEDLVAEESLVSLFDIA